MSQDFSHRHLLSIDALDKESIEAILNASSAFFQVSKRPVRKVPTLRGKTIINLFYEASTRTRTSFELAGKRLSADVVNMSVSSSSVKKGESLKDTCKTLEAMHPDLVIMRHKMSGAPAYIASHLKCGVVNAGDGMHEHPTQALLDALTIRNIKGTLSGLKIAICGDIVHSRVARSNIHLFRKFGSEVRLIGPKTLIPKEFASWGAKIFHQLEEGLEDVDVVMGLRVQKERLSGTLLPSLEEFNQTFGIHASSLKLAKPDAIVMHPGPINRGVEMDSEVADSLASKILDQVEAGVAVRMAVLYLLSMQTTNLPSLES